MNSEENLDRAELAQFQNGTHCRLRGTDFPRTSALLFCLSPIGLRPVSVSFFTKGGEGEGEDVTDDVGDGRRRRVLGEEEVDTTMAGPAGWGWQPSLRSASGVWLAALFPQGQRGAVGSTVGRVSGVGLAAHCSQGHRGEVGSPVFAGPSG